MNPHRVSASRNDKDGRGPSACGAVVLENARLSATILPDDGGRLVSLRDKRVDRDYIWNNERTADLSRHYGADYDSLSAGGVEEAFPCVLPERRGGDNYPFFGEVWAVPWTVGENDAPRSATLSRFSSLFPARVWKTWSLAESGLSCRYRLENLGYEPLRCLFGVHPSLAIREGDRLALPAGTYDKGVFLPDPERHPDAFSWPLAGDLDLSVMAADASSGSCRQFSSPRVTDGVLELSGSDGYGLRISYDHRLFTSLSVWEIFGGWRGHYVLMAEFFTGWPLTLSEAVAQGNCLTIAPQAGIETGVDYSIREGNFRPAG